MVDGGQVDRPPCPPARVLEPGAIAVADLAFVALTCVGFLLLAVLARGVSKL